MKIKKKLLYALKVAMAAIVAIVLAGLLKLQFSVSAGIVAILSVAFTKKETFKTAINRFIAFIAALCISAVCFYFVGFNNYGFFVYLIIFSIICQFMGWNSAMAMDSVLVSHFISFGQMNLDTIINECLLFIIGVGIGIFVNIFLRQDIDYMENMRKETDELIKLALHRMSIRILNPDMEGYDGSCFNKLNDTVAKAMAIAHENYMNQISKKETQDMKYIAMRKRQCDVLYEMYKHLSKIDTVVISAEILAGFFEHVSVNYAYDNTVNELFEEYKKLDFQMKEMPLPTKRKEFEDRARLFAVMRGMEEFLMIKKEYMLQKNK